MSGTVATFGRRDCRYHVEGIFEVSGTLGKEGTLDYQYRCEVDLRCMML